MSGTAGAEVEVLEREPGGGPGLTEIHDRVVSKIARQAVAEVEGTGGVARRLLGRSVGHESAEAKVDADVDGNLVVVHVQLSVTWPQPVRAVTRAVRDRVSSRLVELTGLQVAEVDIEVASLAPPTVTRPTVV